MVSLCEGFKLGWRTFQEVVSTVILLRVSGWSAAGTHFQVESLTGRSLRHELVVVPIATIRQVIQVENTLPVETGFIPSYKDETLQNETSAIACCERCDYAVYSLLLRLWFWKFTFSMLFAWFRRSCWMLFWNIFTCQCYHAVQLTTGGQIFRDSSHILRALVHALVGPNSYLGWKKLLSGGVLRILSGGVQEVWKKFGCDGPVGKLIVDRRFQATGNLCLHPSGAQERFRNAPSHQHFTPGSGIFWRSVHPWV